MQTLTYRAYAATAYAAFVAASVWGVLFLADLGPTPSVDSGGSGDTWSAVLVDLSLLLVFAVQHSVMARPAVKRRLTRSLPAPLERSTYVLAASLALALLFWQWQALPATVWHLRTQPWVLIVWVVYGAGWAIAVASTFMTDHWEFLGLRQTGWLRLRSQSAGLTQRWLYAWVRHPMMFGLLVAFWATPLMTAGHLLFAVASTGYIMVGVHFEERDLDRELGGAYADYARQVPRLIPRLSPRLLRSRVSRSA